MRVLVTGAAGFVGSHVAERLVADGHEVVGIDAFIPESYEVSYKDQNLAGLRRQPLFELHSIDLRWDALDRAFEGVDAVIHLAAMPGLPVSWERLDLYTACNVLSTGNLIGAATRAGVEKFIAVSTSSVYGKFAVGDEQQPLRPTSPYGVTKLAAENLLFAHLENFGFPVSILRYFSIYGPRQRPDMAYHIFIESILDGRPISVYGDGGQSRSNTFVSDCVDATVRALDHAVIGEVYNIGGGESVTLGEAITIIGDLAGREAVIERRPVRPGDQRVTKADTAKATAAFGYQPQIGVREGLAKQFAWHLDRRNARAMNHAEYSAQIV